MAREQRNPFPSLQLAIRQLGDGYLVRVEKLRLHTQLVTITQRREQHEQAYRTAWLAWLNEQQTKMQRSSPDEYARYTADHERKRTELAADPKPWAKRVLDHFDTETAQIHAFREFFGLPDFWQWDADINSSSFQTNA